MILQAQDSIDLGFHKNRHLSQVDEVDFDFDFDGDNVRESPCSRCAVTHYSKHIVKMSIPSNYTPIVYHTLVVLCYLCQLIILKTL